MSGKSRPRERRRISSARCSSYCSADGLQRRGLGARILRDAVAHTGHAVAGRAVPVTLAARIRLRVSAEESLERRPDLWLATDRRKYQDTLEGIDQIGEVPDVLGTADRPRHHVGHPSDSHHDHEFHAYAAQRRPESKKKTRVVQKSSRFRESMCF